VLTAQIQRVQRALRDNIASRFETMREVREKSASPFVKIAGNACAAGTFIIRTTDEWHAHHATATHRNSLWAHRADSESRILAIKKFSR
jgi:hypothetical protein